MYDEENVDIEAQLIDRELLEEQEAFEKEKEQIQKETESDKKDDDSDIKINKNTFIYESSQSQKKKKKIIFTHKQTNKVYEVIVIGFDKSNSDKFVFNATEYKSGLPDKIKIFKYQDLKNIRYK